MLCSRISDATDHNMLSQLFEIQGKFGYGLELQIFVIAVISGYIFNQHCNGELLSKLSQF